MLHKALQEANPMFSRSNKSCCVVAPLLVWRASQPRVSTCWLLGLCPSWWQKKAVCLQDASLQGRWGVTQSGCFHPDAPSGNRHISPPLDFNALCPIHVVAFTVRGKILGVCRRGWLKVLSILCQLQSFGFLPWLIAELYQSHGHSQAKPSNQNIEDSCHVAQA